MVFRRSKSARRKRKVGGLRWKDWTLVYLVKQKLGTCAMKKFKEGIVMELDLKFEVAIGNLLKLVAVEQRYAISVDYDDTARLQLFEGP